jgi:hypothetical protein
VVSDSLLLFILFMQESGCLQWFVHEYASSIVPWSCAGFYEWLVVMLVVLLLELDQLPWYLLCSSQVACPAPPCAWLPSLPALHLLGAWPAPCCLWSCLSNHVDWLWLWVLVWWGEFTLDAQNLVCCLWLLTVVCEWSVLVLWCWCWWCWCWWCWSTRVLGRPVSHIVFCFIPPPEFCCLDTSLHAFDDHAAC